MKVLAISGSLRKHSFNTSVIHALQDNKPHEMSINIYDKLSSLPYFNADLDQHTLEEDNSPSSVKTFRALISKADALIICTPEYAFSLPGVLKNALDWLVSSSSIINKPVLLLSASTSAMGADKAHQALTNLMDVISGKVVKEASLQISKVNKKIDTSGNIIDKRLAKQLQNSLLKLKNSI